MEDTWPVIEWPPAPEAIRLEPKHVHVWAAALDEFKDQIAELGDLLSPTEHDRAERFKFVKDRNRFLIRRGLVRVILSLYLEKLPSAIEFQYGPYGKPEVQSGEGGMPLFFDTSHSAEIATFAITSACPIGVDVERMMKIPEIERLARQFFLPGETRTLMALAPDSQLHAFYTCWTSKEAYLKATGERIAENLAKVEVKLAPEEKPGVVSVSGDRAADKEWQLQPFTPAAGYLGCVAYRNAPLSLNLRRLAKSTI